MDAKTKLLVTILAETDAIFTPSRVFDGRRNVNVFIARERFATSGVAWNSGGVSAADRNRTNRELQRLAKAGLIRVCRAKQVKTSAVELTDRAERETRALCGLPGLCEAWGAAGKVAALSKRPGEALLVTHVWVQEWRLFVREEEYRPQAAALQEELLPALVKGYVVSNSDAQRRASYMISAEGWRWLDADEPAADLDIRPDPAAAQLYDEVFDRAYERLGSAEPDDKRELGLVGIGVSLEGVRLAGVDAARG